MNAHFLAALLLFPVLAQAQISIPVMNGIPTPTPMSAPVDLETSKLSVAIECNFRTTTKVLCNDVVEGIYNTFSSVVRREPNTDNALIVLGITDEAVDSNHVRYTYFWRSKPIMDVTDFPTHPTLDQSALDRVSMLNALVASFAPGIGMYLSVIPQKGSDGSITVVMKPKEDGSTDVPQNGIFDRLQKSPLYFDLDLQGSIKEQGNKPYDTKYVYGQITPEVAYLKDRYKVDVSGMYIYQKASIPNATGYTNSLLKTKAVGAVSVYSMGEQRRWSVAVMNSMYSNPNSNINLNTTNGVGLEYSIVPFRTTQNKELAIRVGSNYNTYDLGKQNMLGDLSEQYMSAFAKVYFYWIFGEKKNISMTLNGSYEENLKYSGFAKMGGSGTLGYQINRITKLSVTGSYSYAKKSLTYPSSPDLSNALLVQQMGGQAGKTLYMQVGISFLVGNSLRKNQDRRWTTQ